MNKNLIFRITLLHNDLEIKLAQTIQRLRYDSSIKVDTVPDSFSHKEMNIF